jgi:hypothetical protein
MGPQESRNLISEYEIFKCHYGLLYFIMVIELSGVQFGLKSNVQFEVQLPLYYIHFEINFLKKNHFYKK